MSVLELDGVTVVFGGMTAADDVGFSVEAGQIFGIIGPNGAGKSTTLNAISGLVTAASGTVRINGEDVTGDPFWKRCRRGLAMTFQTPRSDENLTVAEQLLGQIRSARHIRLGRGAAAARGRVNELLKATDMEDAATRVPGQLTLGEIRRFEFARAMANEPSVLLVDEPSSGMTSEEAILLARSLRMIADSGVAVVVIEHNIPFIKSLASELIVLDAGRIIERGTTAHVLSSNVVKEAYLGTSTAA